VTDELFYPGAHVAAHGDKPAYVMASSGEAVSYRELHERANRIAHLFRDLGLRPGDHVAWCLENHPWFLSLAWGAHYAGLYYTAISSRLTTDEIGYIVDDCGAKVFITSAYKAEVAEPLVELTPGVEHRFMLDDTRPGYAPFLDAVAAQPADDLPDAVEGMDMLYSSGTTGRPKGVKVPLRNVPLGTPDTLYLLVAGLFGANTDTVYLSPAPLYHAAPLRFCLQVQRAGGTVVVMEHFDAEEALRLIERYRVTFGQFVPTMFVRMLKLPEEVRARYDVSSLQVAVHAAAPCPVTVKRQMIDWWGPVLHEYYAGTEGNGFCYTNSEDWLAHPGTVGKPLVGTLHIVGEDGEELPPGEAGTIYFESEAEFAYHNDPEKTAESYLRPGWSTLGDIGYVDEDGFLYLTDRKAYMIITGGVNVYPQEAENVLTMHPKVLDVAVFGVPNEDFGEEVKAVVQPVEMPRTHEEAADLAAELIAFCREHLADVKCPRSVDFREELPRHPTGKLYKRLLKDEYWANAGRTI
jgi:acyl-CoA synthetase (AMP-forming)/AMP-acid ligase II